MVSFSFAPLFPANTTRPIADEHSESEETLHLLDSVDDIVCYICLSLVCLYTLYIYIRETWFMRKSHTLRTFILLLSFISCFLLLGYTFIFRNVFGYWTDLADSVGDLTTTVITFFQYYLVVLWFARVAYLVDDEFEEECEKPIMTFQFLRTHAFVILLALSYITGGAIIVGSKRYDIFRTYQDAASFALSSALMIFGSYFVIHVRTHTNVLDISAETYSVIRRSKYTSFLLATSAFFTIILSGLSLFYTTGQISDYFNVMETKFYSCHKIPCLVNFLIRTIFLMCLPNWAVAFTFSSPYEHRLHLIPLNRSRQNATHYEPQSTDDMDSRA